MAIDTAPSTTSRFTAATHDVLTYLHERLGFAMWMLARVEGEHHIVLDAVDHAYDLYAGEVLPWYDSLCSRMVAGEGPRVAPAAQEVPAYAEAPVNDVLRIGAYLGVPVLAPSGDLFGTMCAEDPHPQPEAVAEELPQVELFARLLGDLLAAELETERAYRSGELARLPGADPTTGLPGIHEWEEQLDREEERSRRFGHPATVAVVRVLDEGDGREVAVRRTAGAIRSVLRREDLVARLSPTDLGVLAPECGTEPGERLVGRIRDALLATGLPAWVGAGVRHPAEGLRRAWAQAAAAAG